MNYAKLTRTGVLINGVNRPAFDGVIVGVSPFKRRYFEGVYKPGSKDAPVCHSTDNKPNSDAPKPQAENCKSCQWRNVKCKAFREIVMVTREFGLVQLHLPAASLIPFTQYGVDIGEAVNRVLTRVEADTTVDYPKALFTKLGTLSNEAADKMLEYARSENAPYLDATNNGKAIPALPFDDLVETDDNALSPQVARLTSALKEAL